MVQKFEMCNVHFTVLKVPYQRYFSQELITEQCLKIAFLKVYDR